ncbi:MAG: lysyl oxidase family protein [Gammaproteobacteria bacterium]
MKSIKRTLSRPCFQFGLLLFLALGINPEGVVAAPLLGCLDPNGECPDLTAAVTEQRIVTKRFNRNSCAVIEGEVGGTGKRKLLRFSFTSPNTGAGDIIVGVPDGVLFEFNTCHGHPHFKEYADYRLWTMTGYNTWDDLRRQNPGALASEVLAAHPELKPELGAKRGFCMVDVYHYDPSMGPGQARYDNCQSNQGISVGWADVYGYSLDGQWIDITGVPSGSYKLEAEVNAEQVFEESNYENNRMAVPVFIP